MAHDGSDGSQYDIVGPWDQDRMLGALEAELAALDAATTDDERLLRRTVARGINEDLVKLHGIDLGPF